MHEHPSIRRVSALLRDAGADHAAACEALSLIASLSLAPDAPPLPLTWDAERAARMRAVLSGMSGMDAEIVPVTLRSLNRAHPWLTRQARFTALSSRVDRWFWCLLRDRYEEALRTAAPAEHLSELHEVLHDAHQAAMIPRLYAAMGYGDDAGITAQMSTNLFCVLRYLAGFVMVRDAVRSQELALVASLLPGPLPVAKLRGPDAPLIVIVR